MKARLRRWIRATIDFLSGGYVPEMIAEIRLVRNEIMEFRLEQRSGAIRPLEPLRGRGNSIYTVQD